MGVLDAALSLAATGLFGAILLHRLFDAARNPSSVKEVEGAVVAKGDLLAFGGDIGAPARKRRGRASDWSVLDEVLYHLDAARAPVIRHGLDGLTLSLHDAPSAPNLFGLV
ncbi:MAG: hypothetical protein WD341_19510 [Tistlia sp.]|uniref:hypothetical protein n=1 Tax=Tistlia sp. TaxID=3057121 RepID=UPI0034A3694F